MSSYIARRPFGAASEEVIGSVTFTNALYRNKPIEGTFDLVKEFQAGGNGTGGTNGFVTVRETNGKKTRIAVVEGAGYEVKLVEAEESVEASRLMTYDEAAVFFGITKDALRKRVGRGTLEMVEVEGTKYISQ